MTIKNETPKNDRMKMIDKIVKLLAQADSTTHDAEAETARRLASELMAKHNIASADIIKNNDSAFTQKDSKQTVKSVEKFDSQLANSIALFNGVAMILDERGPKSIFRFVGTPADIEATEYMHSIIINQRKTAYDAYSKQYIANKGKAAWDKDWTDWRRYMNGFTIGVGNKLRDLTSMSNKKVQEWGLVPVNVRDQALAWYNKDNATTQGKRTPMKAGSKAGFEAGKNVSIHKGLGSQSSVKSIGW